LQVELRRELDVEGDTEIFNQMMHAQVDRIARAMDEFDKTVYGADESQSVPPGASSPSDPLTRADARPLPQGER